MSADFTLSEQKIDGDRLVVVVTGELDLFTAPDLKQRLMEAIEGGARGLVVDLDHATSIDSTALGVLRAASKRLRLHGGELAVVCGDPEISRTFEITGLDEVFPVLEDRDAALERLAAEG
jgi:anti-sigma B factor antagonist